MSSPSQSSSCPLLRLLFVCWASHLLIQSCGAHWQTIDLIPNRVYRLHWQLVDQQLHFRVEVKSRGYFALGFSSTGTMKSADLVTGFVHANGSAILHDRFSKGQQMPEIDPQQDWKLVSGSRNETHLNFEFTRPLATGDASNDLPVNPNTKLNVIYAFGKVDPKDRTRVKYHGPKSRGSNEIDL